MINGSTGRFGPVVFKSKRCRYDNRFYYMYNIDPGTKQEETQESATAPEAPTTEATETDDAEEGTTE
jgi:hypothetical protein